MKYEGVGERLTIYIDETDRVGHRTLYTEIVARARKAGLAGATVVRAFVGFGAASVLHEAGRFSLTEHVPVVIVIVDEPERIEAFLPQIDELVAEGLVIRQTVEVIFYRASAR